jgi:Na+/H+-translocating membrane pyrophosphatase
MPVHRAMREISELIYATCKTYLTTQGKFILILEAFIAVVIILYFGVLSGMEPFRVVIILAFSLIGIAGSYGVAWFGIRVNTFANSRTCFRESRGQTLSALRDSVKGRHEHWHDADQRRTADHVVHPVVHSGQLRGTVLHRFCDW